MRLRENEKMGEEKGRGDEEEEKACDKEGKEGNRTHSASSVNDSVHF